MAYNSNLFQSQLQDLSRQYEQLAHSPQPAFQQQQPIFSRQVQYVDGLQGAKLYQNNMQPNNSEIIMDKEENIFYYVSKDANGTPAKHIKIGRFTIEEDIEEEPMFLTKKDLDAFKEEIKQMLIENNQPKTNTTLTKK